MKRSIVRAICVAKDYAHAANQSNMNPSTVDLAAELQAALTANQIIDRDSDWRAVAEAIEQESAERDAREYKRNARFWEAVKQF